jgi:hypothetical protein
MKFGDSSWMPALRCLGRSKEYVRVSSPIQYLHNDLPPNWWISLVVSPWYSFNTFTPLGAQFAITPSVGAIQPLLVRVPESYITKFSYRPGVLYRTNYKMKHKSLVLPRQGPQPREENGVQKCLNHSDRVSPAMPSLHRYGWMDRGRSTCA